MSTRHSFISKWLILVLLMIGIGSCSSLKELFKKPTVRYNNMAITALTLTDIEMSFDFNITNPNAIGITFTGYDYQLEINDHPFLDGNQTASTQIPANRTGQFQVPTRVNYHNLFQSVSSLLDKGEAAYQLKGHASVKTPIGAIRIPFSKSGSFPLFKRPDIRLASLRAQNLNLTGVTLVFNVEVDNPNIIDVKINELQHNFTINNHNVLQSKNSNPLQIAKKGVTTLTIPVDVKFKEIGSAFSSVISKGTVNYRIDGNMLLDLPGGPLKAPFDKTGSVTISK